MSKTLDPVVLTLAVLLSSPVEAQTTAPVEGTGTIEFIASDEPVELPETLPLKDLAQWAVEFVQPSHHRRGTVQNVEPTPKVPTGFHQLRRYEPAPDEVFAPEILKLPLAREFSAPQRELMRSSAWVQQGSARSRVRPGGPYGTRIRLLAATEPDARAVARAYVEWVNTRRQEAWEALPSRLADTHAEIEQLRDQVTKLEESIPKLKAAVMDLKASVPYASADDAEHDLLEWDAANRRLAIEIAGIQAKTQAIERARETTEDSATRLMLDRLQLEQDVELAGALARQRLIAQHRDLASDYLQRTKQHANAREQRARLYSRVRDAEDKAWELKDDIADRPVQCRPWQLDQATVHRIFYR